MTHTQESRVSSTQDNLRLSEESRSSVSALVSRLNSSALGVDVMEKEKLRGDTTKTKEQKMQDPFPWMPGFCTLCQAAVGSRNVKHLENLMNIYLENVTPNLKDCYNKPNRAAKLKKNMNATLIFFHLFYLEVKEALERSSYLDKMTPLVSMYMDMEIKASLRGKESLKKVSSRLTSSLYIFLDNSEEHMLDAILMTKFIHKNYLEICHPLLWKLLNNISTYPIHEMLYVRCLLTFKLWKKIVPDLEERKRINKTAMQKLYTSPILMDKIKAMGNVLPRIPKTKKNITLFLMQSKFNLKNACQQFFKSVKKLQKTGYNQGLDGEEIDRNLFFINNSGNTSPRLTEKEDESDTGCSDNLINDLWSGICSVEFNVPPTKGLKNSNNHKAVVAESPEIPKMKKKLNKKVKKGKNKKVKVCSGTKTKKKKKLLLKCTDLCGNGKEDKKLRKVKGKKKKKKKLRQNADTNQLIMKQTVPDNCNQGKVKEALSQTEECCQVVVEPASLQVIDECNLNQVKQTLPQIDEIDQVNNKLDSLQTEESNVLKIKQVLSQVEESKEAKLKQPSPQMKEYDDVKMKQGVHLVLDFNLVKIKEDKIEPQPGIPKIGHFDSSLLSNGQIQQVEMSSKTEEPIVKRVKLECTNENHVDLQFGMKTNVISGITKQVSTVSYISSENIGDSLAKYNSRVLTNVCGAPLDDLTSKSDHKDKVESLFDNQSSELFTVEKVKDTLSEKEVENLGDSSPLVVEEGKVVDYSHKSKVSENSVPDSAYTIAMKICDSSIKQEVCDNSEEMETSGVNKSIQIETDSEVEIVDASPDIRKCDDSSVVLCDDGDLIHQPAGLDNIFAIENEDVVMDALAYSVRHYPTSQNILSVETMDLEAENHTVHDELEPLHSGTGGIFAGSVGDSYSKSIKDNPILYDSFNCNVMDEWMPYGSNITVKSYDYSSLPTIWMEDEEEEETSERDLSKSFETSTPKRGMGKMSYQDAVMSHSRQRELRISPGRHCSQKYHISNSSESGSGTTETSPLLTSSASGSSSPHSESAIDSIESACQENMIVCDSLLKCRDCSVSSECNLDASNLRYYNSSNYQKCPETVSCERDGFTAQSSYASQVNDCHTDSAHVAIETIDHSVVNSASSNGLTISTSTPETSSREHSGGTGMQQPALRKKVSSGKLVPDHPSYSQNSSGKQQAEGFSVVRSRPSRRGMLYESNVDGKSSNSQAVPFLSSSVPAGQHMQGIVSPSQAPNIPTNPYPSISTSIWITRGSSLTPKADVGICSCAECNIGNYNIATSCMDEKSYSYYEKIPMTYKTSSDWKSQNEKLLKIEESLSPTKYNINSDTSLPLKKRLKKAKISYEPKVDGSIIGTKSKTKLEGFPSYPAAPMISIAELDLADNEFFRKWNNYYVTVNNGSKGDIVGNHANRSITNLQSSKYFNDPKQTNLSVQSPKYDSSWIKSVQPNLYAHCGQCAEKAVSSVCDSTLYTSASCVGQVYPSTNTSTYSCISSSFTKVSSNAHSPKQPLLTQCYPFPSMGYYGLQSSVTVSATASRQELSQCDSKSVEVIGFKSNQNNSKDTSNRKIGLVDNREMNYSAKTFPIDLNGDNTLQRSEDKFLPRGKLRQCEAEKTVQGGEGNGDGKEEEGNEKKTPQYSIIQKSSESYGYLNGLKKETTRVLPFRIFLNKNKNHKELAKNSCIRCRMVDCKGNCYRSSAMYLSTLNSGHEKDDASEGRCHRKRGRKPKNSRDGDETIRKSKRTGSKKSYHIECPEFVMNYDKKQRKKHICR